MKLRPLINAPQWRGTRNLKLYQRWQELKKVKGSDKIIVTLMKEFKLSPARIYAIIKRVEKEVKRGPYKRREN